MESERKNVFSTIFKNLGLPCLYCNVYDFPTLWGFLGLQELPSKVFMLIKLTMATNGITRKRFFWLDFDN